MNELLEKKYETWKNKLLDFGKRNKLINYKDTKRSSLIIKSPSYLELWNILVENEERIEFPTIDILTNDDEMLNILEENYPIKSNKKPKDILATLKNLRNKARLIESEQGINTLYLSFGFLKWKESPNSNFDLLSPLVIVPVNLSIDSILSPYILNVGEDDILVNPTLNMKLQNDFGFQLPDFDGSNIEQFFRDVSDIVSVQGWEVVREASLSILSFMKINMYHDLLKNKEDILNNPIIQTIAGVPNDTICDIEEVDVENLDETLTAESSFQIVDADSSQLEAIYHAKKGHSFVLQGPPGTGKSQTITNIIAECLAEGKKVLFVSEKMAALDVVHNRLLKAGLDEFCLVLHTHKAKKKEILNQLSNTLYLSDKKGDISEEAYQQLNELDITKKELNEYAKEVFKKIEPFGESIYYVNAMLSQLDTCQDETFDIKNVFGYTKRDLKNINYYLNEYANVVGKMTKDYLENPWYGCNLDYLSNEMRQDISANIQKLSNLLTIAVKKYDEIENQIHFGLEGTFDNLYYLEKTLGFLENYEIFPYSWLENQDFELLYDEVQKSKIIKNEYELLLEQFIEQYKKISLLDKDIPELALDTSKMFDNEQIKKFSYIINKYIESDYLFNDWITNAKLDEAIKLISKLKEICISISNSKNTLFEKFEKSILDIDYNDIEFRFKSEYTNFTKIFKSSYRQDKKVFMAIRKRYDEKITDEDIVHTIEVLRSIDDCRSKIKDLNANVQNRLNVNELDEHFDFSTLDKKIEISKEYAALQNLIRKMTNCTFEFFEHYDQLQTTFENTINGLDSDWDEVKSKLDWALKFRDYFNNSKLSDAVIKKLCSDEKFIQACIAEKDSVLHTLEDISNSLEWQSNLYEDKDCLKRLSFENVLKNIDLSSSNLKLLEEWIDYKKVKSQCENFGLTEFLELMHEKGISTDKIINIFNKRFYTLWLDKAYEISPSVANFRRRIQDQRVLKFKELDKQQFKISEARIKEKLMKNLPSPSKFTNGSDELRILKREASKQRRIMPLRQLFASIPNLILSLKPCLMMSPLSVSVFLATDAFKFDVVIFDEASQVQTENAIGAIFRGKQVIIAGDSKQLPPTNFFNVSNDNDDFYDEDDMASNETYESILDEANLLPEKTLLWHYRSRHESLIAFSNAKIYNNRLTTFPSNISEGTDVGVEYIYVDKGLYDRGGRKGNVLEAKRVAKLVFEHFKLHPNKSLGVIAFGEVQQQAIDNEITQMRLQNKDFESFFNEELPEPFFVKNLENVQGDERDTIIFSIGYGFDVNGDFKMNFGPLSRVGGERRLNVAVTRAKYNIKLVGSIKPTDINLDRVSTEGPKLLRKYIEFAIQGQSVLEKEIKEDGYVSFDSPFEKSVYNFLDRNGYNVATQVGCSGYKIDLAIKHPQKSGVYTLAIECDGAAYHSGKNARERDRLRQEVLENMGWKFYRIWSTDWIKDSISEGKKLLDVVEKSIIEYDADNFELDFINLASEENNEKQYITLKSKTKEDFVTEYGFKKYMDESNLKGKHWNSLGTINERIFNLVKIAYPIDLETICYECKMFYGREKVTKVVREDIQYRLSTLNDKIIKIDNYYFPKYFKEIYAYYSNERHINNISMIEQKVALRNVLRKATGYSVKNLIDETSKVMGFTKNGKNISSALTSALKELEKSHNVEIRDDIVYLKNDEISFDGKLI